MRRHVFYVFLLLFGISSATNAQNYLYATGVPSYATSIPVDNGFINVNNGELHLEIPLASTPQRRGRSITQKLVYDSRIWQITNNGGYSFQPTNVPNSMGGWTFQSGQGASSIQSFIQSSNTMGCDPPSRRSGTVQYYGFGWTDALGTYHVFNTQWVKLPTCVTDDESTETQTGYATDASGYTVSLSGDEHKLPTLMQVFDKAGNQVAPFFQDTNGNYTSSDGTNVIDMSGRTPVTMSTSGNQIFYDVLGVGGNLQRYTVTTETINVYTHFRQSGVSDAYLTFTAIQSIGLPDGSSYSFTYDSGTASSGDYGELTSMTLPTGGTIQYGYNNFLDSFNNENRWLSSVTKDGGTTTLTPHATSQCSSSASCNETIVVTDPAGNDTSYGFVLDAGIYQNAASWNSAVAVFQGPGAVNGHAGTLLGSSITAYSYTTATLAGAMGTSATYLIPHIITTTTKTSATAQGVNLTAQTKTTLDAQGVNPISVKKWDYYTGSAPTNPTVETDYTYGYSVNNAGYLTKVETVDGSSNRVSMTTYGYDETTPSNVYGISNHATPSGSRGNLTATHLWLNTSTNTLDTTAAYDTAGVVLSVTTPAGTTTLGHDATDVSETSTTWPTPSSGVSLASSAVYDSSTGVVTSSTGMNPGQTTTFQNYDSFLRPTSVTLPSGSVLTTTYTPTTELITQTLDNNNNDNAETSHLYDGFGRLSRGGVLATGSTWYMTDDCYDASGKLQFQSVPYATSLGFGSTKRCTGAGTSYTYDTLGRVTGVTNADGTVTVQYGGRAVKSTDVNNVQKIEQYDGLGRLTGVCEIVSSTLVGEAPSDCGLDIAGSGFLTTYGYTLSNHTMTMAQGVQTRSFQTDSLGRNVYTYEPERGITAYSYAYNSTGLQVTRTRPRANQSSATIYTTTTTQYDSLGRPISVSYMDGGATNVLTTGKSFTYDLAQLPGIGYSTGYGKGRLIGAVGGTIDVFNYDIAGNITGYFQCLPAFCGRSGTLGHDLLFSYGYDLVGNRTSDQYQNWAANGAPVTTHYGYNSASQLTSISGGQNNATSAPTIVSISQSSPFGPSAWTYGNGLTAGQTYDSLGRVAAMGVCADGSFQAQCNGSTRYSFSVTPHGSQLSSACDSVLGWCSNYGYDEFNRLISNSNAIPQNYTYTYDRYGNRLGETSSPSGPAPGFSFDTSTNHIGGMSYDAAGNMLTDGFYSYQYDAEGNMVNVTGGQTGAYVYNSFNRRVEHRWAGNSSLDMPAVEEIAYNPEGQRSSIWDGSTGNMVQAQTYWGTLPLAYYKEGAIHFQHQDWHGSLRVLTSNTGVIESGSYELAYGDAASAGGRDIDAKHFAGLDSEYETGTNHAQFREYSPGQGRWMSPDPSDSSYVLTNPQSMNRYSYVNNNPLGATDPTGLSPEEGGGAVSVGGGCIGAVASGGHNGVADVACIGNFLVHLFEGSVGGGPSFNGTLRPRPSAGGTSGGDPWNEHLGLPQSIQLHPDILGALGLPESAGCEFGACGAGLTQGDGTASGGPMTVQIPPWVSIWAFYRTGKPGFPWHYGNWCGAGGSGHPKDNLDGNCELHDFCYATNNFGVADNVRQLSPSRAALLQGCNQRLCDAASIIHAESGSTAAMSVVNYFWLVPRKENGCH